MNPGEPAREAVLGELAAILASPPFAQANRSRRFLEYTVHQTLAGAQDSIKEIVLAAEVFDRKDDFDPRVDPIVRVEAGKLRARLQEYYSHADRNSTVCIEMPKGGYVPRFVVRPAPDSGAAAPSPSSRLAGPLTRIPPYGARPALITTGAFAVLVVLVAGGWWWLSPRVETRPPQEEIRSIAVLPMLNLGADPRDEYLSDGLSEQLTDVLTQIDGLRVVSRTSAFTFKGKPAVAADIGRKLRVTAFLEGSVQRSGDRVRITAQLIRTADGYHVWSQTFDREFTDAFGLRDEVAEAVARALKITLADDVRRRMAKRYTKDPEAFDLYLRGRHAVYDLQLETPEKAIALFQRAIDRDPSFALAYVGIASATALRHLTNVLPAATIRAQARAAAEKALQIDDTLAEAHAVIAVLEAQEWNWSAAEARFRHALALNPQSPEIHHAYAQSVLLTLRQFDKALAECDVALELDPLSIQMQYCRPWTLIFQGKADEAIREFQDMLAAEPDKVLFREGIAFAAISSGDRTAAAAALSEPLDVDRMLELNPVRVMFHAYLQARFGDRKVALALQHRLEEGSRAGKIDPSALALVYLGTGQLEDAKRAAAESIRQQGPSVQLFALLPLYAPLRADPEFAQLLRTTGIPF